MTTTLATTHRSKPTRKQRVAQSLASGNVARRQTLPEYLEPGSVLSAEFSLLGRTRPVKLEAEVMRAFEKKARGKFGVGLRFTRVPQAVRKLLRQYVQELTR